jgi:aromatic-L-amino-acid/L-tryptophan decarboxylase
VCFRYVGGPDGAGRDELNAAIIDAVNRSGEVFLSHTRLDGRFVIRLAVGNLRTEERHVARAWQLLRDAAARLDAPA